MEVIVFFLLMLQNITVKRKKNSGIKDYKLCLDNISRYFTINNMKKRD